MAKKKIPVWSFLIPAAIWLLAAIIPIMKGGRLNTTFFVLALVFAVLGGTLARRKRGRADSQSPAP